MTDLAYPWNAIALVNRESLELDPRVMAAILAYIEANIEIPEPASTFPPLAADIIGLGSNMPRASATNTGLFNTSGQISLSFLTAAADGMSVGPQIGIGSTAGSGLTFNAYALYSVAGNGDLTKIAETANQGATVSSNSSPAPPWASSVSITAGQRYAVAKLYVGTSPPSSRGVALTGATFGNLTPYLARQVGGQTSFPATILAASQALLSTGVPYAALRDS